MLTKPIDTPAIEKIMISIIVPIYNSEKTLERCIKSATGQTYRDIEIILVNDGSTDRSDEICRSFEKSDNRIRYYYKENGGVSEARNLGIREARGEFIMMLDSDDEILPDACNKLLSYQQQTSADIIIFGMFFDRNIAPGRLRIYETFDSFKLDFPKLLNSDLISSSLNKFYKRELMTRPYPENSSFGEDLIFVLDCLMQCNRILLIPDILYVADTSDTTSLSRSIRTDKIFEIELWQKAVLSFMGTTVHGPELFKRYTDDSLNCVRELYCSRDISYETKKHILKAWYPTSYLRTLRRPETNSYFYKLLLFCVRHRLWLIPQLLLITIRGLHKLGNKVARIKRNLKP